MSRSEIVNKSTTKDSPSVTAEPKYKVGDEVRILRDTNRSGLSFGDIVKITGRRCYNDVVGKYYYPTNRGKNVREDDVELVEPKLDKQEDKVDTHQTRYGVLKELGCVLGSGNLMSSNNFCVGFDRKSNYNAVDVRLFIDGEEINPNGSSISNSINQQEEINMTQVTTRKTVTVNLIDRDSALDEKYSLVAAFGEFVTSKSTEALIRSIMIDPENDVAGCIAIHNEVRVTQIDKDILKRTGNKVMLEPIEESDLYWEIS